jgi:hypothetical protein
MATERFGIFDIPLSEDGRNVDDFRNVPASDKGNDGYRDRGMLGNYAPSAEPFPAPPDVRFFAGYGASEADIARGYCQPLVTEDPAYALQNYKQRSTQPRESNLNAGETDTMNDDWEFRRRNTKSRGFLTRPHIPTERG